MTSTNTTTQPVDNGFNIDAVLGAREAMTAMPAAAAFTWRASNEWVNGTHSRTTYTTYFGAGEEQAHRQPYTIDADHPELFAAEDNGPTPAEIALGALASCLTGGIAAVATNRGINVRSVTAHVAADMDIQGILGIDPEVRNGFSSVRVTYEIDGDATHAELASVVAQSQKRSAVFDVFSNPTAVTVELA